MKLNNKKGLSKLVWGYLIFLAIIAVAWAIVVNMHVSYVETDLEILKQEYGVDEARGDMLIQCADGSYDVYRPIQNNEFDLDGNFSLTICGTYIDEATLAQIKQAYG